MPDVVRGRSIALIGMMGAGKSTVGRLLSRKLGVPFFDSDAEIEARTGMTVAQIFREQGEPAFRQYEAEAVCEAVQGENAVIIGVAGGAVLREDTRKVLEEEATVVWLCAPIDVLIERVIRRALDRPMIAEDPEGNMRRLYEQREPIYRALADVTVAVDGKTPDQIADHVIEAIA